MNIDSLVVQWVNEVSRNLGLLCFPEQNLVYLLYPVTLSQCHKHQRKAQSMKFTTYQNMKHKTKIDTNFQIRYKRHIICHCDTHR